jgi:hypothetical protein
MRLRCRKLWVKAGRRPLCATSEFADIAPNSTFMIGWLEKDGHLKYVAEGCI